MATGRVTVKQRHEIRDLVVVVDHVHRQQAAGVSNLRISPRTAHSSALSRGKPPTV